MIESAVKKGYSGIITAVAYGGCRLEYLVTSSLLGADFRFEKI